MRRYFEGWYFKQHTAHDAIAFIPAYHIDADGKKSSSLQIITDDKAYWLQFPYSCFEVDRRNFCIKIGKNVFSSDGMLLDIQDKDICVSGKLRFGAFTSLKYDIMGPFKYIPFMECRHKVFSMLHMVSGDLLLNGEKMTFRFDPGYIEGDRGTSFPKSYAWTQCIYKNNSIMLSIADIPFMGTHFTGIIGAVIINGHEYRIATYRGARAMKINNGLLNVQQGDYSLTAELISKNDNQLRAPIRGDMTRFIRESPGCVAAYRFEKSGVTLLSFTTDRASFEYEYSISKGR